MTRPGYQGTSSVSTPTHAPPSSLPLMSSFHIWLVPHLENVLLLHLEKVLVPFKLQIQVGKSPSGGTIGANKRPKHQVNQNFYISILLGDRCLLSVLPLEDMSPCNKIIIWVTQAFRFSGREQFRTEKPVGSARRWASNSYTGWSYIAVIHPSSRFSRQKYRKQ